MPNILQSISDLISPATAEAKVTALDVPSLETIQQAESQASPGIDNFKKLLHNVILQKAQQEKQNVDVQVSSDLPFGVFGLFEGDKDRISLSARRAKKLPPGNPAQQNTLAHELLHFLFREYARATRSQGLDKFKDEGMREVYAKTSLSHDMIKHILGDDKAPALNPYAFQSLRPLVDKAPTESGIPAGLQREILQRLFKGTPLQQGVIQEERR